MWGALYWAKNFFGGLYWGPPSGVMPPPAPPIAVTGGHYGEDKRKKKKGVAAPWENEAPRPGRTIREQLMAIANAQDEEDIFRLLMDL